MLMLGALIVLASCSRNGAEAIPDAGCLSFPPHRFGADADYEDLATAPAWLVRSVEAWIEHNEAYEAICGPATE